MSKTLLEQLRVDAGLTTLELGAIAGVSHGTISRVERGRPATAATLKKLADALNKVHDRDDVRPSQLQFIWPRRQTA